MFVKTDVSNLCAVKMVIVSISHNCSAFMLILYIVRIAFHWYHCISEVTPMHTNQWKTI